MLWDVNVSILVDATNNEEAMDKVSSFLGGKSDLDCNFMTHCVDKTDDESLLSLRERAKANAPAHGERVSDTVKDWCTCKGWKKIWPHLQNYNEMIFCIACGKKLTKMPNGSLDRGVVGQRNDCATCPRRNCNEVYHADGSCRPNASALASDSQKQVVGIDHNFAPVGYHAVAEGKIVCVGCAFEHDKTCRPDRKCTDVLRPDKRNVIFVANGKLTEAVKP